MSITAYFVSEQKLKDYTPISPNLDSGKLVSAIRIAQDIVAQESLGQSLYEKMQELVTTGDISLSGNTNYKSLLDDYIVPCCMWNAYYVSLDFGLVEYANAGLVSNSTEQGSAIDLGTFKTIKNGAKHKADFYTEKLKKWLRNQNSLYPEYNDEISGETLPNTSTGYKTGIVFDSGLGCRDEILFYGSNYRY
jgi:hypothetical protein